MLVYFGVFDDNAPFAYAGFPPGFCQLIFKSIEWNDNTALTSGLQT